MSDLQRYNPTVSWSDSSQFGWQGDNRCSKPTIKIVESTDGQFVKYAEAAYLIEQLQAERDALVAHIERLEDEITGIINDSVGVSGYHMNGDIASWQEFDIKNILEQSPQNSLAERDVEVANKAIESFKDELVKSVSVILRPHIEGVCAVVHGEIRNGKEQDHG